MRHGHAAVRVTVARSSTAASSTASGLAADALPGRTSTVERSGGDAEDELVVSLGKGDRRPLERILAAWFRERATEAIDAALAVHAAALRVQPSKVDIRDPTSRWGSASRKGRLMFSWRLILAPPASLETVVVHELAHLRAFGHGPAFWALVASRRPGHLADRAWLRRNSHALHAALESAAPAEDAIAGVWKCWWAGAELNCHSRRRGFYRPLGSPPAQPTR